MNLLRRVPPRTDYGRRDVPFRREGRFFLRHSPSESPLPRTGDQQQARHRGAPLHSSLFRNCRQLQKPHWYAHLTENKSLRTQSKPVKNVAEPGAESRAPSADRGLRANINTAPAHSVPAAHHAESVCHKKPGRAER